MASEIIERDQNYRTVGAAVGMDSDQDISMLRCDPVTKYLLVEISSGSATSANASQIASRDQNNRTVCMAWDETNQVLQEVLTDADGYLLVDLELVP
jgi:hypothetical protein